MGQLGFAVTLLLSIFRVVPRRLSHGPLRPTWSWKMEIFMEAMGRTTRRINELPPSQQAEVWQRLALPNPMLKKVRIEPVLAGGVPGEWIIPMGAIPERPVIFYLHGGWYSSGSVLLYRELLTRLALACRCRVFAIDYRLAPECRYPAAIDDTVAAWRWLLGQRLSAADIVVAGDSAGSGLALALMLRLHGAGEALPGKAVLICPWVDLSATEGSILTNTAFEGVPPEEVAKRVRLYIGDGDPRRPEVSPVFADLRGLPPMLVQGGTAEMLIDQETAFVGRARAAGVDVTFETTTDMTHDWHLFASVIPQGVEAIDRIAAYVRGR